MGNPKEPSDLPLGGWRRMNRVPWRAIFFGGGGRARAPGSALRMCEVGRVAFCLAVSLPSESGGGREPGSMSFPCGTVRASRKLPFPGDFCGEGEECPRVTLRPPGLGAGLGSRGDSGAGSPGPR